MLDYIQELGLWFELKDTPESSQESYLRRVKDFAGFVEGQGKKLEDISTRDIQGYILYLKKDRKLAAGTINNYISSIRVFCIHVLDREWDRKKIPRMRRVAQMPVILPREDVLSILNAVSNLKHKAILSLLYGSGLRVSEVAGLRIGDILSKNMSVRVENAKHGTNRYTILSRESLKVLRDYFRAYFAQREYVASDWLFPGKNPGEHVHVKTIKNTMIKLRDRLGLDVRVSAHTLRHCFATHLLEEGVEPVKIQYLLGHKRLSSTVGYLHFSSKSLMGITSPLDK
ncbi:MAG: tyrosine-type recombinase/integrase [Bacillota bacterium]|jgi:integrase/recombinase XerD